MFRLHRWAIFAGACVVLAIFALAGALRPVGDLARSVMLPVVRLFSGTTQSVVALGNGASNENITPERVKELETRLANLVVDYVQLRSLEEENRALRAQAKFLSTSGFDSVGARVISRDMRNQRALLLIDRGLADHLEVGQAVITNEGVLIGKIGQMKDRVATVELITDPQSRVAATVPGRATLLGILEGRGHGSAVLTYVPASEPLKRDDVVVTAGTEEKVPPNLPLGIVNEVEGKSTDPFVNGLVESLVPLDRVIFVSVLRPSALRPNL